MRVAVNEDKGIRTMAATEPLGHATVISSLRGVPTLSLLQRLYWCV